MVKKSDVEKDVSLILDDLKENDYEIPTLKAIFIPVLVFLKPLYIVVFLESFFSFFFHFNSELWAVWMFFVCGFTGLSVITFIAFLIMYVPNKLLLCLSDEAKRKSVLCGEWRRLLSKTRKVVTVLPIVLSVPFIGFFNWGFTVPMWVGVFCVFISGLIINATLSQYLTPEVIRIIKTVRDDR